MHILFVSTTVPEPSLVSALEQNGYTISHTRDTQHALDLLTRSPADLTVVNLFFKQLAGILFLGQIRANHQTLPIITTGPSINGEQSNPPGLHALALGIHTHLTEPLTADAIMKAAQTIPQAQTSQANKRNT